MPDTKTAVPIGRTPLLGENPRPAKMFLERRIEQVAGHASREGHWGWDGASLEYVSAIAHDPIESDANLYGYVDNGPTTHLDPMGLQGATWQCVKHWGFPTPVRGAAGVWAFAGYLTGVQLKSPSESADDVYVTHLFCMFTRMVQARYLCTCPPNLSQMRIVKKKQRFVQRYKVSWLGVRIPGKAHYPMEWHELLTREAKIRVGARTMRIDVGEPFPEGGMDEEV